MTTGMKQALLAKAGLTEERIAEALRVLMAAKSGDTAGVQRAMDALSFDPEAEIFGMLFYAWTGRREDANRLAARYDTHPWGQWALWQAAGIRPRLSLCNCRMSGIAIPRNCRAVSNSVWPSPVP